MNYTGKTLDSIILTGSQQSRATGWLIQPGYCTAKFTDGSSAYLGDVSMNLALQELEAAGVDCRHYRKRLDESTRKHEPGPAEKAATLYQGRNGWEIPESLGEWAWSVTFGRWGRTVTFAGQPPMFTWPKL